MKNKHSLCSSVTKECCQRPQLLANQAQRCLTEETHRSL